VALLFPLLLLLLPFLLLVLLPCTSRSFLVMAQVSCLGSAYHGPEIQEAPATVCDHSHCCRMKVASGIETSLLTSSSSSSSSSPSSLLFIFPFFSFLSFFSMVILGSIGVGVRKKEEIDTGRHTKPGHDIGTKS